MPVTIYHNPRCSKSRQTLALLEEKGVDVETVLYLQDPPDAATLADIVAKLGLTSARDLMRKGEAVYKDLGLKDVTDEAGLIQAMADHPILIERPIVLNGDEAKIGRPPEGVLDIV
jgi:arsenate reductase